MNEQQIYQVALHLLPGIGPKTTKHLISYCGSAQNVLSEKKSKLLKIPGVGEKIVTTILNNSKVLLQAEKELKMADKENAKILFYTDTGFPQKLKEQFDSPILVYYKGNANLNKDKIISIVGTRNATEYGKELTDQLVAQLASDNVLIVSGLAYGIDIQAHRSSLTYNVSTLGVMASGIDRLYPSQHKSVADKMLENGGILTEEPLGTKPDAPRFPARNRIIAGMSDCTIVVEAAIKGGALITARIANSYNKEVFSYPGSVKSTYSEGTNFLIKNHEAHMVTCGDDIIKAMNWEKTKGSENEKVSKINISDFNSSEQSIISALQKKSEISIDELCWNSQIPVNEIASHLISLEFQGVVKNLPGKKYRLIK